MAVRTLPAVAAVLLAGEEMALRSKRHWIGSDLVSMSAAFGVGLSLAQFVTAAAD